MDNKQWFLNEINPHALITLLIKNLWVCVLMCISAVLCFVGVWRLTYVPEYTSTATFMVSAKDSTSAYNSLTLTQSMASVFVEVFQSNVLREKIDAQMPDGSFDGTIYTTTVPETNLLIVTVTSSQPDTAFHAMNLLVENYSSISDYLFANAQLEVIKDPVVPVAPSNAVDLSTRYPWVVVVHGCQMQYLTPGKLNPLPGSDLLLEINGKYRQRSICGKHPHIEIRPALHAPILHPTAQQVFCQHAHICSRVTIGLQSISNFAQPASTALHKQHRIFHRPGRHCFTADR